MKFFYAVLFCLNLSANAAAANGGEISASAVTAKTKVKHNTALIKTNPQNAQAYADRAAAKLELGEVFSAIRDYSRALVLAPDEAHFLQSRGHAFLQIAAYKEALSDFNAVQPASASVEVVYGRAVAKYYIGDLYGALSDLNQVVAATPEHPQALYNRAVLQLDLNHTQAAITDFKEFLQQYPNHTDALLALHLATVQLEKENRR